MAYLQQTLDCLRQRGIWVTGMLSRGRPSPFGTGEVSEWNVINKAIEPCSSVGSVGWIGKGSGSLKSSVQM